MDDQLTRRQFLRRSGLAALSATALAAPVAAASRFRDRSGGVEPPKRKVGIGLQLYTVRDDMAKDPVGTIKAVAKMGYPAVQTGPGVLPPKEFRKLLDDLGITVCGFHVGFSQLQNDLPKLIEESKILGNEILICPGLPEERTRDAAAWRETARLYEEIGAKARAQGIHVGHHNHTGEFERHDGKYGFDYLLEGTTARNVCAELDTCWAAWVKVDPAAYIRKYPGRFLTLHIKDISRGAHRTTAEVGEGILDWPAIFAAAESVGGTRWYIVEQDSCQRPPLESVKLSLQHLREWGKL